MNNNLTKYIPQLYFSRRMVFECGNDVNYTIESARKITGPNVIKRDGEKILWPLFFGGVPKEMDRKEIKLRSKVTLNLLNQNENKIEEIIGESISSALSFFDSPSHEQTPLHERISPLIYHPENLGLVEKIVRPEIGMRLTAGLIISNNRSGNDRYRIIISNPITNIYCLP